MKEECSCASHLLSVTFVSDSREDTFSLKTNNFVSIFLQVALLFSNNLFCEKNILRNYHTYIVTNASYEGICVEFEIFLFSCSLSCIV